MRKEASLPVRLDPELNRRLTAAAERLGTTKSALIRLVAKSFVEEFEASGGQIPMPPQWQRGGAPTPEGSSAYRLPDLGERGLQVAKAGPSYADKRASGAAKRSKLKASSQVTGR